MTNSITTETQITRNDDVLFSEVADGMSLMNIESGKYFHFDKTGAQIWKQMDDSMQVGELCAKLEATHQIDSETCRSDTAEFLTQLSDLGLITVKNV